VVGFARRRKPKIWVIFILVVFFPAPHYTPLLFPFAPRKLATAAAVCTANRESTSSRQRISYSSYS
jgi:hypothetical protein